MILMLLSAASSCAQDSSSPAFAANSASAHRAPRALAKDAVVEDWPGFLGVRRDAQSKETSLDLEWGASGPKLIWETPRGEGFAQPVVVGLRVLHFHRVANSERLECRALESGALEWVYEYPCNYRGEVASDSGPRATPLVHGAAVFVHGVEGELHAVSLADGKPLWKRDLSADYATPESWFGVVSSPIARGSHLYVNVGGQDDACVVALDVQSGKELWRAAGEAKWGASSASPVLSTWQDEECLFVLSGGKTRPVVGGLLVIRPGDGTVLHRAAFRSRSLTSVNGCSPLVIGDSIFLTASYGTGSVCLGIGSDGKLQERWRSREFGVRFSQPLLVEDTLILIDGVANQTGALVGLNPINGSQRWRAEIEAQDFALGEGSLLALQDHLLALGDGGDLFLLSLTPEGPVVKSRCSLFAAPDTWTPPVLSHGLLLICQNERARAEGITPRLLCYDLRAPD